MDFLAILMIAFLYACHYPPAQEGKNKNLPNILFIAIDDLKPAAGCYGDSVAITPHMDKLAEAGITFMRNYCQQAVCAPSRASLLTGRYPDQLQVWDLQTLIREKNPGIITLPQYFRMFGYLTASTGKIFDPRSLEGSWGGPHDSASWSVDYISSGELNTYNPETGPPDYFYAGEEARNKISLLQDEARRNGKLTPGAIREYVQQFYFPAVECVDVPFDAYVDGAIAKHGLHLMDSLAGTGSPFFLAVGFNRPHLPFAAPKKYWDLYKRNKFSLAQFQNPAQDSPPIAYHNSGEIRSGYTGIPAEGRLPDPLQRELIHGYYAAVTFIDDLIGMLLEELDVLGIRDHTIIVLWGDHGWHLGDHGLWCKHSNFEQATRSPLIMLDPDQRVKGGKHDGPTEFTDIAPTLCELTGIPIPDYFEGLSLKPLFDDPGQKLRTTALSQYPRHGIDYMGYSIRTERYRYTKWIEKNTGKTTERELYDYQVDPLETTSFIHHEEYTATLHYLDSILTQRIQNPSTRVTQDSKFVN
ncbi:MAG: sulfatase [Cyclobacteriaceae bacterium]|nr:sulfatase [Cyclobacteriaceae bacterium]